MLRMQRPEQLRCCSYPVLEQWPAWMYNLNMEKRFWPILAYCSKTLLSKETTNSHAHQNTSVRLNVLHT